MGPFAVIFPAAGRSRRFGDATQKKIYHEVDGRAVWATYHPSAAIRFGPKGAPRAGLLADLTAVAGTLA